jgi:putative ABC transport system permease protein
MWLMLLSTAVQSLRGNPLRSLLAMSGVVIGVAAVIAMLAVGAGAEQRLVQGFARKGAEVMFVFDDWGDGRRPRAVRGLDPGDAAAIAALPEVAAVAPVQQAPGASLRAAGRDSTANVIATSDGYFACTDLPVARGRLFTASESELGIPVAVLGTGVAGRLFPDREPIGQTVLVGPVPMRVVGVLAAQGRQGFLEPDEMAIVPLAAARRGLVDGGRLGQIQVLARPGRLEAAEEAVGRTLLRRHRLADPSQRDFAIYRNQDILNQLREISGVFAALLAGIAAVSLLVGGIGIMNIMLVAVTERTREIGLRKAIGARERDIRRQFLIEAALVTGTGGIIGVLLGWGLTAIAAAVMPFPPVVQGGAVLMALAVSVAVGLFFGWYPARRAARLDPIEALRHE